MSEGDEHAFEVFYRRHRGPVTAFFRRRVSLAETAFDLTAETFAAVVRSAPGYRGDGPPAAWLYGIARHKLDDSLRRGQVESEARRHLSLEPIAVTDADLELVEEQASEGSGPLSTALASLPVSTRQALVARVVDDASYEAIAHELACSEQVVRKRVQRGLDAMRTMLGDHG